MKYRVVIIHKDYLNVECEEAVRVVGRARARPAERAHHAGGLPIVGVTWRGPLPLYNHCEGESDAPELCGAEECE